MTHNNLSPTAVRLTGALRCAENYALAGAGIALTENLGVRHGAYGLSLPQISDPSYLCESPDTWPDWTFESLAEDPGGLYRWSPDSAELPMQPAGRASIDRGGRRTILRGASVFSEPALLHPLLGTTALANAVWSGRFVVHAGAIFHAGGAWALVGEREAGKSSALGWCANAGIPIVTDDLVVTDGTMVQCGPRIIDLRQSAAEHFQIGEDVGVLGTRRRWRVRVGAIPAEVPLLGWIELAWGSSISLERIPLHHRLEVLDQHRGLRLPVDDRVSMMRVLALPAMRFTRPKSWAAVDDAMSMLLSQLASIKMAAADS